MNRKIFSIVGLIILSILLFGAGTWVGHAYAENTGLQSGWIHNNGNLAQSGYGMMGSQANSMMDSQMMGGQANGMMGGSGMMNGQYSSQMNNGQYGGMMGMMMNGGMMGSGPYTSGMMGNFGGLENVDPMSLEDAETAVTTYLATRNNDNLTLGEIMIFDNHAYAQIMDNNTGLGAFEVLIDPTTGNVLPEPGPNMMWNTEYGMMAGNSMMGNGMMNGQSGSSMMGNGQNSGMMGGNLMGNYGYAPDAEINITAEEAVDTAQEYLDAYLSGKMADETADQFPGYYTLHVLEDGETIGMLSVNAYTGQVFLHQWHGDFIEMVGEGHE
jgi:hypothetical protein